jgi:hypothetical protein
MLKEIVICFCLCASTGFAQKLTGTVDKRRGQFKLKVEIAEEGSFQVQRATNFANWTTITNFNSPGPATLDVNDSYSGARKFYWVLRQTNWPAITLQPQSLTKYSGEQVKLEATATGSWPLRLQWYKGGNAILNQTNSSYTFTGKVSDSGTYQLLASNLWKATVSSVATVQVIAPAATTIANRQIHFDIQGGRAPLITSGSYDLFARASGDYSITSSNALLTDQGYWFYTQHDEVLGYIQVVQSFIYPGGFFQLLFESPTTGQFTLTSGNGYQFGRFTFAN